MVKSHYNSIQVQYSVTKEDRLKEKKRDGEILERDKYKEKEKERAREGERGGGGRGTQGESR